MSSLQTNTIWIKSKHTEGSAFYLLFWAHCEMAVRLSGPEVAGMRRCEGCFAVQCLFVSKHNIVPWIFAKDVQLLSHLSTQTFCFLEAFHYGPLSILVVYTWKRIHKFFYFAVTLGLPLFHTFSRIACCTHGAIFAGTPTIDTQVYRNAFVAFASFAQLYNASSLVLWQLTGSRNSSPQSFVPQRNRFICKQICVSSFKTQSTQATHISNLISPGEKSDCN